MNNIATDNIERDADSLHWARELGWGNTLFKNIVVGHEFCFTNSDVVHVKVNARQFVIKGEARRWTTGARAAVFTCGP